MKNAQEHNEYTEKENDQLRPINSLHWWAITSRLIVGS